MDELLLLRALDFAAQKHRDQRRKGTDASPYINHPIAVARLLAEVGGVTDTVALAGAILHDTLEDTATSAEELETTFDAAIRALVEEVTDNKRLPKAERKRLQIAHAPHLSTAAALIKLGDKIANVRDMTYDPPADWSLERRQEYLDWAEAVVSNCPRVNQALEAHFARLLQEGRRLLFAPQS